MKKFEELTNKEVEILAATGLLWEIYPDTKPKFDRESIFKEVDESNKRFDIYSKEERASFKETVQKNKSAYEWYPKTEKDYTNPYAQPRYFVEYHSWDGIKWNYKICQRMFIIPEEDYQRALEERGDDVWLLMGIEGHPYTLTEGSLNTNEHAISFDTKKFLEYIVDALNEKVENDILKKVAENWKIEKKSPPIIKGKLQVTQKETENRPYYECRKCNRRLEELQHAGKAKFCGDFWKCTDCNNDITKDLKSWYSEVKESYKLYGKETRQ
jgi:hypothetical protein